MTKNAKATIRHSPLLLGASMLALIVSATALQAQTRIAVLAENYSEASATQIATEFAHIFQQMQPGDSFIALSASGREILSVTLPNDAAYNSSRLRDGVLAPAWGMLMQHFSQAITLEAHDTQVNFPLIIHDALRYRAMGGAHVAFFGDPLWNGAGPYAAFALTDAYPTDTHFAMDRSSTPFGQSGDEPLSGMIFHFCQVEGGQYLSGAHEEGVRRAYGLMSQAAGAQLVTFSADISACSRRFITGEASNAPIFERDTAENRFSMISGQTNARRATPVVPSNASPALTSAIQAGIVSMVRLRLYDHAGEDGDIVQLSAPGYTRSVSLTNAGETFDVPLVQGSMRLLGIHDGGGGITVSVSLEDGTHLTNGSMSEGEEIALVIPQNTN